MAKVPASAFKAGVKELGAVSKIAAKEAPKNYAFWTGVGLGISGVGGAVQYHRHKNFIPHERGYRNYQKNLKRTARGYSTAAAVGSAAVPPLAAGGYMAALSGHHALAGAAGAATIAAGTMPAVGGVGTGIAAGALAHSAYRHRQGKLAYQKGKKPKGQAKKTKTKKYPTTKNSIGKKPKGRRRK